MCDAVVDEVRLRPSGTTRAHPDSTATTGRMNGAGYVSLLALLAAGLSGCGRSASSPSAATDSPVAYYESEGPGGDAALLEGVLVLEDGCLLVRQLDGTRTVPIFPDGEVTWEDSMLGWEGQRLEDGEQIALSGGFHQSAIEGSVVPFACPAASYFVTYVDGS